MPHKYVCALTWPWWNLNVIPFKRPSAGCSGVQSMASTELGNVFSVSCQQSAAVNLIFIDKEQAGFAIEALKARFVPSDYHFRFSNRIFRPSYEKTSAQRHVTLPFLPDMLDAISRRCSSSVNAVAVWQIYIMHQLLMTLYRSVYCPRLHASHSMELCVWPIGPRIQVVSRTYQFHSKKNSCLDHVLCRFGSFSCAFNTIVNPTTCFRRFFSQ